MPTKFIRKGDLNLRCTPRIMPPASPPIEATAWLTLACVHGVRPRVLNALLDALGGPDALLGAGDAALAAAGASASDRSALHAVDPAWVAAAADWLAAPDHALLVRTDDAYPAALRAIPDPPVALFCDGDPAVLQMPALAIVGSRNPTATGADTARQFAGHLARHGLVITSGLATGIDSAAHEGALAADGGTVAVLGTGIDQHYPSRNRELQRRIADAGVVVSEYAPGVPAAAWRFPARNRIISGLSMGTLVVEATRRSGSLITARLAGEQGRSVFAIPGSIHSPLARGCHELIRQGALLVESADDIFRDIGPRLSDIAVEAAHNIAASTPDVAPPDSDDADYVRVKNALSWDPQDVDTLASRTGLTAAELSSMLLIMELDGVVTRVPGGGFVRSGR